MTDPNKPADDGLRPHVVLYQPTTDGPRAPWGEESRPTRALVVRANSVAEALEAANRGLLPADHRAVAVEEGSPGLIFTKEAISAALSSPRPGEDYPLIDPEDYEDYGLVYGGGDFMHDVQQVADALRDSGLVPRLSISPVGTDGYDQYVMVEMHVTDNTYRATGRELKHLTEDRSAEGWDGIIAIARALLSAASEVA